MDVDYINNSQTSEKTDVYSIGALAFVLITGGSKPWNAIVKDTKGNHNSQYHVQRAIE